MKATLLTLNTLFIVLALTVSFLSAQGIYAAEMGSTDMQRMILLSEKAVLQLC